MNIALVVLDTLRYDAFETHFDWLPGIRFTNAWAPGNWTVPVHGALFTGKYPSEIGTHAKHTTLDCQATTLAESLSSVGYRTRAFSNNVNITPPFGFDRGFDSFRGGWRTRNLESDIFDWESFITGTRGTGPQRYVEGIRQCVTNECATWPSLKRGLRIKLRDLGISNPPEDDGARETLDYIREHSFGDQEFLFVNLMEAHWPYNPPSAYQSDTSVDINSIADYNGLITTLSGDAPADSAALRTAYDDSVQYLSIIYRQIFAALSDSFDYIITLGDHGELFGEHDAWQHAYGLTPELTHVPLAVSGNDMKSGAQPMPVSLLDVYHTIMALAGAETSSEGHTLPINELAESDSESAEYSLDERACFTEYHGVNQRNAKRAIAEGLDPSVLDQSLVGVATTSGYGCETADGLTVIREYTTDTSQTNNPEKGYRKYIKQHRKGIGQSQSATSETVPPSLQRQLEALGYG